MGSDGPPERLQQESSPDSSSIQQQMISATIRSLKSLRAAARMRSKWRLTQRTHPPPAMCGAHSRVACFVQTPGAQGQNTMATSSADWVRIDRPWAGTRAAHVPLPSRPGFTYKKGVVVPDAILCAVSAEC